MKQIWQTLFSHLIQACFMCDLYSRCSNIFIMKGSYKKDRGPPNFKAEAAFCI